MFKTSRSDEDHKNIIEQGFTLVELLIVIVILGILAGIVVFAVGNLTDSAATNACKTEGDTYATAVQAYRAQNNPHGPLETGDTTAHFNGDTAKLKQADLINSTTLKYGNAADVATPTGWVYGADRSVVTTACPA